ncbi:phage holin family protein [Pelagibacterium nitratireducens]|uniref:Phage holin family protein n=1 Tax=Pelagibacterium nitratireducens TaxID=1046114 RepID=A0ABZ2I546_9HYPH
MALTAPFTAVTDRATSAVRSMGLSVAVYAIIGLIGLVGLGFLIAALYIWLAQETGPLEAALIMGAGFLVLAGISLGIVIARHKHKKEQKRRNSANTAMMASTVSLASTGLRIASRARGRLFWPAVAAIALGWYFGTSGGDDDD